jgi:hypothetical protein
MYVVNDTEHLVFFQQVLKDGTEGLVFLTHDITGGVQDNNNTTIINT